MHRHNVFRSHGDSVELELRYGTRLFIENNIFALSSFVLLEQEQWFERDIDFCMQALSPGAYALDLGANIGIYSTALAKSCGTEGRVAAIDPGALSLELLRRSAKLSKGAPITVKEYAIGGAGQEIGFVPGLSSELSRTTNAPSALKVPLKTLDEAFADLKWDKLDFIKMDIEGAEEAALLNGQQTLARHCPAILLEINDGSVRLEAARLLERLGYALYRFVPGLNAVVPTALSYDSCDLNVFALPAGRIEALESRNLLIPPNVAVDAGRQVPEPFPDYFERMAPAQSDPKIARLWRRTFANEESKAYLRGLAALLAARRAGSPLARRQDALRRADALLTQAAAERRSFSRLASLATCKSMLGDTRVGASLSSALVQLASSGEDALYPDEPLLPPSPGMEKICHGARVQEWSHAVVLSNILANGSPSSFYNPDSTIFYCSQLIAIGYGSAAVERRRQLSRVLIGQQEHIEPSRLFSNAVEGVLNRELWPLA
jgi:FkbM family methyltransferase